MIDDRTRHVIPLSRRLDLLFRVWRASDGTERSHDDVARAVSIATATTVSADDMASFRRGTRPIPANVVEALAEVFPSSREYLLDETAAPRLHTQLTLIDELVSGGIRGVRLRGGDEDTDPERLTAVLRELRERRERSVGLN
ncbi:MULTISPECIES: hypothetical protein [Nocardiaceae]|uniref:Uncharacterized protein n=1 Tax=Rhodococcoides kroppenstedtii TaxID=293050 RepID=A0ABS7NTB5_9NOCA|nr:MULTISPECIES: hypothetical protein [Rhodococcus]AMY20697.1 hypothetical protein A3Q40_03336 [Rhodococcus sp. PBTS 1]MBY6313355.1 hypothetical protein [Rhodococcus kroppenstedtii]MBY6321246.1 hypothetical protein [Rhodococcus kroppenstedtii]MBY6400337.1 hypothetical protein [Rhodococcus kroppenstedtii]